MTDPRLRRGRPLGELASSVLAWSRETCLDITHLDVAHALQMPRVLASKTLFNLRDAGYLREVGEIYQDGASKPVKVCAPVAADAAPSIMVLEWPR